MLKPSCSGGDDAEESQDEFELAMIEAAYRAVGKHGTITRIRVCLPGGERREPDDALQQILGRVGENDGVSLKVDLSGKMRVVRVGPNNGIEKEIG